LDPTPAGRPARLIYVPNEDRIGDQVGARAAFESMDKDGRLSAYASFSFLVESRGAGSPERALAGLLQLVSRFGPDIILWQHVGTFPVSSQYLKRLKSSPSHPLLVYHEADVFGRLRKRAPPPVRRFAAEADMVFLCGLGWYADLFRRFGAKTIRYAPHVADTIRFGTPWDPTVSRRFDAVLIGNRLSSRLPFFRIPGASAREKLVSGLTNLLGDRFAVYGRGWEGFPSWRGPLPYAEQERALREAWVGVSWDHFDTVPLYFSDRLPIALLSGVAHVTNRQPGYDTLFRDGEHLLLADTVGDAVDAVIRLLGQPKERIAEIGSNGRRLASTRLTADIVFPQMLRTVMDYRDSRGRPAPPGENS